MLGRLHAVANGVTEGFGGLLFRHMGHRTGLTHGRDDGFLIMHGKSDYLHVRERTGNLSGGGYSGHFRHVDIHDFHVRAKRVRALQCHRSVFRFPHDFEIRLLVKEATEAFPDDWMIVHHENSNLAIPHSCSFGSVPSFFRC